MPLAPGEVFAGYTVVRQLGTGGMGSVYLVRHPRLPRHDALKLLRPELSADPSFAARFEREADMAAALSHPNIVSVFDRGEAEGQLWLTMQYVDGTDAEDALAEAGGLLPAERAVHIVAGVAAALDFAHRQHLVHRDVKPANILLTGGTDGEPERVLLTDFGIAKSLDAGSKLTMTGSVVATLDYASPEQLEDKPLDARSDVYSLGCVLLRLLTGNVPYPGETVAATIHGHLLQPPPRPTARVPWLAPALDDVVAQALAKDPADRYPTCRALAAAAARAAGAYPPAPPGPYTLGLERWRDGGVERVLATTDRLPGAEAERLAGLVARTRFFDLPERLAGRPGRGDAGPRTVGVEITAAGRTHRVVADLDAARRPPEFADLVTAIEQARAPAGPAPATALDMPAAREQPPAHEQPPVREQRVVRQPTVVPEQALARDASAREQAAEHRALGGGVAGAEVIPADPPPVRAYATPPPPPRSPIASPAARAWTTPHASAAPPAPIPDAPAPPETPPGPPPGAGRGPRRGRPVALAAGLAVLVAGGVTAAVLLGSHPGTPAAGAGHSTTGSGPSPADAALAALPRSAPLPDGTLVVPRTVDGNTDLYLVDAAGGAQTARLTSGAAADFGPIVSPDRRTIVYQSGTAGGAAELRVMAADGSGDRPLFEQPPAGCTSTDRPAWDHARPTQLGLVCLDAQGRGTVHVVGLDGAVVRTLDVGHPLVGDLAFSYDGTRLAYWAADRAASGPDGGAIYTIPADGSGPPVRLTDPGSAADADPSWSPDDTTIAFRQADSPTESRIWLMNADGSNPRVVTGGSYDQDPIWSPDGTRIAFKSNRPGATPRGGNHIWTMSPDGRNLVPLNAPPGTTDDGAPAWGSR